MGRRSEVVYVVKNGRPGFDVGTTGDLPRCMRKQNVLSSSGRKTSRTQSRLVYYEMTDCPHTAELRKQHLRSMGSGRIAKMVKWTNPRMDDLSPRMMSPMSLDGSETEVLCSDTTSLLPLIEWR